MYTATLTLYGVPIMERHGDTPEDAEDALGFEGGPGYSVEVEEVQE